MAAGRHSHHDGIAGIGLDSANLVRKRQIGVDQTCCSKRRQFVYLAVVNDPGWKSYAAKALKKIVGHNRFIAPIHAALAAA